VRENCRVWAYLETWIVQDGQFPGISLGAVVDAVGLSFTGHIDDTPDAGSVSTSPGIAMASACDSYDRSNSYSYVVVGKASFVDDAYAAVDSDGRPLPPAAPARHVGAEFLLTTPTVNVRAIAVNATAEEVAAFELVRLRGHFNVMPEHEYEYGEQYVNQLPRSWTVRGIRAQRYALTWTKNVSPDGRTAWEGQPGAYLDAVELDSIDPWEDERRFGDMQTSSTPGPPEAHQFTYVVDLVSHQ